MKTNAHIRRIVEQHRAAYKTNIDLEFSNTTLCVYIGYMGVDETLKRSLLNSIRDKTTTVRSSEEDNQTRIYVYRDY